MIKTSVQLPSGNRKTGSYDRAGQSESGKGHGIKTSVSKPGSRKDNFYGGKPGKRSIIKTTGGC